MPTRGPAGGLWLGRTPARAIGSRSPLTWGLARPSSGRSPASARHTPTRPNATTSDWPTPSPQARSPLSPASDLVARAPLRNPRDVTRVPRRTAFESEGPAVMCSAVASRAAAVWPVPPASGAARRGESARRGELVRQELRRRQQLVLRAVGKEALAQLGQRDQVPVREGAERIARRDAGTYLVQRERGDWLDRYSLEFDRRLIEEVVR